MKLENINGKIGTLYPNPERSGYYFETEQLKEDIEKYISKGKTIVDFHVDCCCFSDDEGQEAFNFLCQNIQGKSIEKTYLFCEPSCSPGTKPVMRDLKNLLSDFDQTKLPSILVGSYLSSQSGWDCGDARNISRKIEEIKLDNNDMIIEERTHYIGVLHRGNPDFTDKQILERLLF